MNKTTQELREKLESLKATKLEQVVIDWILDKTEDYDDIQSVIEDLLQHGCQSGMVSDLISYSDTIAFYLEHQKEIDSLLYELLQDTGLSVKELFGDKWDDEDPLANDQFNRNLLAWFAFEETCHRIANNELELDI